MIGFVGLAASVVVIACVVASAACGSKPAGQPEPAAGQAGPVPRTPWDKPDLQGIWTDETSIPLQRPAKFGDREVLTDAEIAELDTARAAYPTFSVRSRPVGTEQDVAGAYGDEYQSVRKTGRRTSLIVAPKDGRIPAFTPEAEKSRHQADEYRTALLQATTVCKDGAKEVPNCAGVKYTGKTSPRRKEVPPDYLFTAVNRSDGPEDRGLGERCLGGGFPNFGGFHRIVQSPDSVSIFYDIGQGQGRVRVIPISDAPHAPPSIRQWWGDSRGRWEGDTLVVDVTNFNAKRNYQGSRQNLHLVERWTRKDATTLEYVLTLDDPTTWTGSWTARAELQKQNDRENRIYYEPRCHEGNFAMPTMLLGARMDDERFAKGRGPDPATKCYIVCLPAVDEPDPLR
jgi:hypothetical protein